MKKLWNKWTEIALVKRILVGLVLGAILGLTVPGATGISILGDVFVSALKAIAPLLVFFLVISSLCNAGNSHGGVIKTVIILYMFSTVLAAVIAVFASMAFPVKLTLATAAATDTAAPQGIAEVLNNLLLNVVANPVSSLVNANYVGILTWAILLGLAFRAANDMTKNVLNDIANGTSAVVSWIINMAPFGIFGLVFNTVSTNGLEIFTTYGKLLALLVGCMLFIYFVTNPLLVYWCIRKNPYPQFGSGVLAPILKDVPYVNKILPDDAVEQVSTEDSAYAYDTMADAVERIKELEKELADAQNASSANADYISQLEAQSQELQQYKENEAEFEKEKQSFYEDVVFSDVAPDIEEYKKYYESIDPANAEVLYKQVVAQTAEDEQLDDYIKTYSSMKPKEAAAIFDTMTDNLKLVAQILDGMDADSRAAILGKMTSDTAAKVTEIMKPSE